MKPPPHLSIPPTPANSWLSENAVFLRKYKSCHRISGTLGTMVDHNTKHLISPDVHHGPIGFVQWLIKKIFSSIGDRCWRPWESIINQPEQYRYRWMYQNCYQSNQCHEILDKWSPHLSGNWTSRRDRIRSRQEGGKRRNKSIMLPDFSLKIIHFHCPWKNPLTWRTYFDTGQLP